MKISCVIICRNEEKNIKDCIKSVSFADEIIVIDNKSTDDTVKLAAELGARIFVIEALDFSYLRNIGKEKAKNEWIFYIDADERVTEELGSEIKNTSIKQSGFAALTIIRQNYYLGHIWPKKERIVRLIKKDKLIGWQGSLHETPQVSGKIGNFDGILLHFTHNTLHSMVEKTNEWSEIESQLRYKNNHPKMSWWRFPRVMFTSFWNSYVRDSGWKAGTVGLIESIYQSFSHFITYAKLWEKQNIRLK